MSYCRKLFCMWSFLLLLFTNVNAEVVTKDGAARIAENFMKSMGCHNKKLVPYNISGNKTYSRVSPTSPPAFHIFHGENNEGFVIISGDDIAKPILGYSFNNILVDSVGNFPPAMKDWLSEMESQILYARKKGVKQSAEVAQEWKAPKYSSAVVQLKTAQWNQGDPFNRQCPLEKGQRCVTGCVPTAYAILMKYYGFPTHGRGETQGYTCEESGVYVESRNIEHAYQWNMMPLEYKRGQYNQQQANSVSQLMADIGAAIQSDYSVEGTAAGIGESEIFAYFDFNPGTRKIREEYSSRNWYSMLCAELDKKRPILYRGAATTDEGGHAFILDGYTNQNTFCVNWGWGGSYNGTFALDALIPGGDDYRSAQEAYLDCVPASELPVVAKVGEIECPSLKAAFSIVPKNGRQTRITLLQNTAINYEAINENQNIKLDLNGFTVNIEEFGVFNYGRLCVVDGKGTGKMNVRVGNNSIINNYGFLEIEAGEFCNLMELDVDEIDYRRCIWSAEETVTEIKGGKFICTNQVLCTNGDLTIYNGGFQSTGNSSVISNYSKGTLTINDGIFENALTEFVEKDYRRCVWTDEGTITRINGGNFTNESRSQTLCFNGNAIITNSVIENKGTGIGCASNGHVKITDCMLCADRILYTWDGATLKCSGGLYSQMVGDEFLEQGYNCVLNNDLTSSKYPYRVELETGINTIGGEKTTDGTYYDLNGKRHTKIQIGVNIIRKSNGKSVKILHK